METAYLAGGCFWGLEELLRDVPGVTDTEVGYNGGDNNEPTYENHPGHAESVKITYDPVQLSFEQLLDFFFRVHDPTTHNRQGNDVGSSYRSSIFYTNDDQKQRAAAVIRAVDASKLYPDPVVTNLKPLTEFWPAEDYHQDYLRKNPGGYTCHYLRTNEPIIK